MKYSLIFCALVVALIWADIECKTKEDLITDEEAAKAYLVETNTKLADQMRIYSEAQWAYATNINDQTSAAQIAATKTFNEFQKKQAVETKKYDWSNFEENVQRQFEKLAVIGTSALNTEDENQYTKVTNEMETLYSSAKVCVNGKCDLELDPDLDHIMANSKNYSELLETWVNWRDAAGKPIRENYITYFTLGNKAATLNKLPNKEFKTLDDLWLFTWETPDIKEQTAKLWNELKPFYAKIHAYVRMRLKEQYPDHPMPADGTIPAHLLGNMWAQQWSNIMNTVKGVDPYPEVAPIDVTQALVKKGYNAKKMFELSDKFFADLTLDKMTETFWNKSLIEKPSDRTVVCHASAWDFYGDEDFRIKQCTNIDMEDLITIHHEMGHIEYFMQYKNQPSVFRDGANPGFHEAIGDLLALSVSTPNHLVKVDLLDPIPAADLEKINLKYQIKMALDKVMFLPFGYIMDKWRWDVFSGEVSSDKMNRHWWKLRGDYQGLSPPVNRSDDDFDPGCKYHIPASVEYIRYFASHILQFQFHKKLCSFGQKNVSLHECDIDSDVEAGQALKVMLQKGSSEKWPKQLEALTGSSVMDVKPLIEYFNILDKYLDTVLTNEKPGWTFNVDDYFQSSPGGANSMSGNLLLLAFGIISVIIAINFV